MTGSSLPLRASSVTSAVTRLPGSIRLRPIWPEQGAVMRVKSTFNWAASTLALAAISPASDSAFLATFWSYSSLLMAPLGKSFWDRSRSAVARFNDASKLTLLCVNRRDGPS